MTVENELQALVRDAAGGFAQVLEAQKRSIRQEVANDLTQTLRDAREELAELRQRCAVQEQRIAQLVEIVNNRNTGEEQEARLREVAASLQSQLAHDAAMSRDDLLQVSTAATEALAASKTAALQTLLATQQDLAAQWDVMLAQSHTELRRSAEQVMQALKQKLDASGNIWQQKMQTAMDAAQQGLMEAADELLRGIVEASNRSEAHLNEIARAVHTARGEVAIQLQEIQRLVAIATESRLAVERVAQDKVAITEQMRAAAQQAEAARYEAAQQVEQLRAAIDRVYNLDAVMKAMYEAVRGIHLQNAAPNALESPNTNQPTLTPGQPEFDYLTLFLRIVGAQWEEVLKAARENRGAYFTALRQRNLDLALYGDPAQLLNAQPETNKLAVNMVEIIREAQVQRREELRNAGVVRIEGKSGDRERPYWLVPDPNVWVDTEDPSKVGTFADIQPGNAGYELNGKALRPTVARFYRHL